MNNYYNEMSKGAQKIYNILRSNRIPTQLEYSPPDLHSFKGVALRFDFAIMYRNTLVLIEFDGEQHFHFVKHFHKTYRGFLAAQERDRKKNSYCLAHNIPLFRIPFTDIDNITSLPDILQPKYRVLSIFHNDTKKL